MSNQNKGCGCVSLMGGLLLAGSASAGYFYLRGDLPWQNFDLYSATQVIPQETVLIAHVSTEEKLWSQLSNMGNPEAQAVIKRSLNLPETEQIRSWLGGVTFALVSLNNGETEILIVAGIKDKIKAWEYQQKLSKLEELEYEKVKIYQVNTEDYGQVYFAILDNYLVGGPKAEVVKRAIDSYQEGLSFQDREGLKASLSEVKLKNVLAQVYIHDLVDWRQTGENLSSDLEKIGSFNGAIGLNDQGLHLQSFVKHEPQSVTQLPSPPDKKILASLPADTWFLIHGNNLSYGWQNVVAQAQTFPEAQQAVDLIRDSFAQFSIDVDREVFGWMDQDYAIALTTTNKGFQNFNIGGIILIQMSDPQTAQTSLDKFSTLAQDTGFISLKETEINRKKITQWNSFNQPLVSHSWIDKNSLALTIGLPFQTVTEIKPAHSLLQNETYKQRVATLPDSGFGYFYLDMQPVIAQLDSYNTSVDADTRAILTSIEGMVGTTSGDKTSTKSDLIIFISQK
ncbi:DUF3352 domain-containing protein [Gloeocapsa sp. PCC 73106]|uniref:DUF3352 domain-containing protein n=1 Tax=Gloeocapsa sp. PCC 73106 TaxID=102232 RepID=UPI0002ACFD52|nr:DUF3352 domain-containing protein [Gloeocapsa sp. PCC 73106]ELR96803.1 Protein of unknown function (DUF3352) [Gloeocapsa sp. PCC 73106]